MFSSFSRSYDLVKQSFGVLRKDKEIMLFPIVSAVSTLALLASFVIAPLFAFQDIQTAVGVAGAFYWPLLFAFYLLSYFIVIFFNTGLIACADIRLNGGDPTFRDGIRTATKSAGKIFLWALISATVGVLLGVVSERSKMGRFVRAGLGTAWSLLAFFVIPAMIFEGLGVVESIKRSGELMRKTWGENLIGQFSTGVLFGLLAIAGLVPLALTIFTGLFFLFVPLLALTVLYWALLAVVNASLKGIFVAALYNYAKSGKAPSDFSAGVIEHAFSPMGARMAGGII